MKKNRLVKKNRLASFLVFFVLFAFLLSGAVFAQITYVNNTTGDDLVGHGTQSSPYKTIAKGIDVTPAGGTVSIAGDVYGEANVKIKKALTLVANADNGRNTVTITNGVEINTTNATDVVSLGVTGEKFNLGSTANALTLTRGNLQITSANVTIDGGGGIIRTAGTINNTPTTTNVNVTYNGTVDITSGPELPANIGTGILTVAITTGKKATFSRGLTTTGGVTVTTGDVDITGDLNLSTSNFTNNGGAVTINGNVSHTTGTFTNNGGAVTINGNVAFTDGRLINASAANMTVSGNAEWVNDAMAAVKMIDNTGNGNLTISGAVTFARKTGLTIDGNGGNIWNGGTGTLTLAQGFTTPANDKGKITGLIDAINNSTGKIAFGGTVVLDDLTNNAGGTVELTGGMVAGSVGNNAASSTIELKANTTFSGGTVNNGNAASVIKLNSNTLTLSNGTAVTVTNNGKIISNTAATIGNGIVAITGKATINNGELPNVTVAAGKTLSLNGATLYGYLDNKGAVTLAGNLTVKGNYNQTGAGMLTFGANTFTLEGDWVRTSNVPSDVIYNTGKLVFAGGNAQNFTSGASLKLYDIEINKTHDADQVTLTQTVEVDHNFTITKGTIALGSNHIRMTGGGAFVNNSNGYTSSGEGYLIFETAGKTYTIDGTKPFSNIDIRDGATVNTAGNVSFSGIMNIRKGSMNVLTGHTFTYTKDLVSIPLVKIWTDGVGIFTNVGTIAVGTGVVYDLYYTGDASATAGAEWLATGINNLTIATGGTTPNAQTITAPTATPTSLAGVLTVNSKQILALTGDLTLAGNSKVHSIFGKVINNSIDVTGKGVVLNGSTATADDAEIPNLKVSTAAGESFTSNNLKKISGDLTVVNGTASIHMNATTAIITGNVTLTDGTLDLNMASTTSTHVGNLVLTKGTMTYTRGSAAAQQNIGGNVTLTDGTLNLGSNVNVTGATTQAAGNLVLGNHNYTQNGSGATPDYNRTGAGTVTGNGYLILDATAAAIDVTPGATFKVPNLEMVAATNGITFNAAMEVTNALTHTSGSVNYSNLTFSGNTYNYITGTIAGAFTLSGPAVIATFNSDVTIPTLTVNSAGYVTIKSDKETASTPVPRTITVSTLFTQTKGDVNLGINTLNVIDFVRTTGNWTQGTGYLVMNDPAPTLGTGFAIDNLEIPVAVDVGTSAFTVNKNLVLKGSLTTSADGKLTLGDNVLIERQSDGATLSHIPTFGARTNLKYSTATAAITTAKELPATVENLTVAMGVGGYVILDKNITVNGTLSLASLLDATTTASVKVTMADGSTLELKAAGNTVLDEDLTKAGTMDIVYGAAVTTSARELGAISPTAGAVTLKGNVILHADATFTGTLTFDGGNLDLNGKTLNIQGDVFEKTNNGMLHVAPSAASKVYFSGANNTTLTIKSNRTVNPNVSVYINKTNKNNTITLVGGNLDFVDPTGSPACGTLHLTKGVLVTGNNFVILEQDHTLLNQPNQGFERTDGVIAGNVRKYISNQTAEAVDRSKIEFPTGTIDGYYRPASFFFKNNPPASINLTVNHVNASPGGTNGIPINTGTVTITNYPDFHWLIKSDMTITPSYEFDMELQAEGYTEYVSDEIQNVRLIRRDVGNINNPWVLQGKDENYDNSTIAPDWPVVKVIDAKGGITSQGCLFSYSQSNKAPSFVVAPAAVAVNENDSLDVVYEATDPDIGQTLTYSVVGTLPPFATFATKSGKGIVTLKPGYDNAGSYSIKISVTDGTFSVDTITAITVNNVNRKPAFVKVLPDTLVIEGTNIVYDYNATDGDGESLTFAVVAAPTGANINATTGVFSYTPAKGLTVPRVDTIIVSVTDKIDVVKDTAKVTVIKPGAPYFTDVMPDITVNSGNEVSYTYVAVDPNASTGDIVSYSLVDAPAGAVINASTGVFKWTPNVDQVGKNNIIVKASDQGGLFSLDTAVVTVKSALLGDVSGNGAIGSYDATLVLQHVAGMITLAGDSLTLADVSGNGTVGSLDASYILQYVAGIITKFPAEGGLGKILASTGEVKWEAPIAIDKEGTIALPVFLKNASNVYAIQFTANIDPEVVNIESVKSLLPEGWLMVHNVSGGKLSVAMAGTTPLAEDREIAVISLKVSSKNVESSITGEAIVNENEVASLEKVGIRQIPNEYKLSQNYPNPFNPTTNISFQIKDNGRVMITIYDILGKKVRTLVDENLNAGYYTVQWNGLSDNGMSLSSGTYFYKIDAGSFTSVKRMLLIK